MRKRIYAIMTLIAITISIFGYSSIVFAFDEEDSNTLYRGGNSVEYGYDNTSDSDLTWSVQLSYATVPGLPPGIFGNNYIATRMWTYKNEKEASLIYTINCNTYQTTLNNAYKQNYGGLGQYYRLRASMKSTSTSTKGYFNICFSA